MAEPQKLSDNRTGDVDPHLVHEGPQEVHEKPQTEYLNHVLKDANHLLAYAVEAGIEVEPDIAQQIISATQQGPIFWRSPESGLLITAITKLAAKLHPVTAETLRACREEAEHAIRSYKRIVTCLALIIIPLSIVGFISAGISGIIKSNIDTGNQLVLKLHSDLSAISAGSTEGKPPSSQGGRQTSRLQELQQLAITARIIYSRTKQLNLFLLNKATDKVGSDDKLELPAGLIDEFDQVKDALTAITKEYQKVRLFASNVLDGTAILWGAISTCLLPVLYALLGACASVVRAFTQQTEARTFSRSYASPARFIVAAIGGGVIGLFNISLGEGLTASPLALAFLVGYAADVFFSFLEGSIQNVRPTTITQNVPPRQSR